MADELKKVTILRRTRATGGYLLLPGKTYEVSQSDFMDLVRCGKGEDPTGEVKLSKLPKRTRTHGEMPGGTGESMETVGTSSKKASAKKRVAAAAAAEAKGSR